MKPLIILAAAALLVFTRFADAETPTAPQEPTKVTKLDGTSFFGIVEVTDDYTIRVKSDTGIQKIPLALLGEKDFKKFGFEKDRSQDGKFWSERKEALEAEKSSGQTASKNDDEALEIPLAEIAPFQPLIDAYEKSLADQKPTDAPDKDAQNDPAEKAPFRSLFSQQSVPGAVPQPFTGIGSSAVQPATSLGAGAVNSVSGATGLPVLP